MFFVALAILVGIMVTRNAQGGPHAALWAGWLVALLMMPIWLSRAFGSLIVDMRVVAGALGVALVLSAGAARLRFTLTDLAAAALAASVTMSYWFVGELRPLTFPDILRRWLLPYAVGRLFVRTPDDVGRILPMAAVVLLALSAFSIVEAFTKVQIVNRALGKRYGVLEAGEGYRWGLKRSQGFMDHPIFYGNLLVLVYPWAVEAARRSSEPGGRWWWRVVPWMVGFATVVTVSRGAHMALVGTVVATMFFRWPRWRAPMAIALVAAAILGYGARELLMDKLGAMAGEDSEEAKIIWIDGEEVEYTGTKHRILLYRVYGPFLRSAGWFGHGFAMRPVQLEEDLALRFGSIDNHFILFQLQHGWAAVISFVAVGACALWQLGRLAWPKDGPFAGLAAPLFGAMLGVTALLNSVWFAHDFGAAWLFSAGLAAAMSTAAPGAATGPAPTAVEEAPPNAATRPRLHPGHAPERRED